jgi:two-component system, cell cycle sensor histidine kinase and response regulator CckA
MSNSVKQVDSKSHPSGVSDSLPLALMAISDGFAVVDAAGRIIEVNDAFCALTGYERAEVLLKGIGDFDVDHDPAAIAARTQTILKAGFTRFETHHRRKDGTVIPLEISVCYVDQGEALFYAFHRDLRERKRAEQALLESESKFRTVAEQSPNMIFINLDGRFVYVNEKCSQLMGYTREEIYAPDFDFRCLIAPDSRTAVEANYQSHLAGLEVAEQECGLLTKDGRILDVIKVTKLINYEGRTALLGTVTDITERKAVERELSKYRDHLEDVVRERTRALEESRADLERAQRLASIGTLAAGIAHEINNPVGEILLAAQSGLDAADDPEEMRSALRRIGVYAGEAKAIVRNVLRFARQESSPKAPGDLNELIVRRLALMREYVEIRECRVHLALESGLPPAWMNAGEMEQVVVNLLTNAVQAQAHNVTITTGRQKDFVTMAVADDGSGMDAACQEHIFDPFFTTRGGKGGTGLGLSIVHAMIEGCGGRIAVTSRVGAGTTLTISLPLGQQADSTG